VINHRCGVLLQMLPDKTEVFFEFDDVFEIHDDTEVLKFIARHEFANPAALDVLPKELRKFARLDDAATHQAQAPSGSAPRPAYAAIAKPSMLVHSPAPVPQNFAQMGVGGSPGMLTSAQALEFGGSMAYSPNRPLPPPGGMMMNHHMPSSMMHKINGLGGSPYRSAVGSAYAGHVQQSPASAQKI